MLDFNANLSKKELMLNSRDADVYLNGTYNSSMVFYFDTPITVEPFINILVKISSAVFPISMYVINNNNNKLYISNTLYTLTNGNYSTYTLRDHLNTLLSSASITVSYSNITNKFTFTKASSFTINSTSTCLHELGFADSTAYSGTSIVSPYMADLSGVKNIYVCSDLCVNNIDTSNKAFSNILLSLPVAVVKYGLNVYQNSDPASFTKVIGKNINSLTLNIYDEKLQYIDFNNVDWTMTFEFQFSIDREIQIPPNLLLEMDEQDANQGN